MRPVLASIVQSAVDATGAERGWLVTIEGDTAVVSAAAGGPEPASRVGQPVTLSGAAGLALQGGHAVAINPGIGDTSNVGAGGHDSTPSSILAVPCGDEEAVGVLEVVAKAGGARFSFDDVELCTLLAGIAGAALDDDGARTVPSAAQLSNELKALESADPQRYSHVADVLVALLGL